MRIHRPRLLRLNLDQLSGVSLILSTIPAEGSPDHLRQDCHRLRSRLLHLTLDTELLCRHGLALQLNFMRIKPPMRLKRFVIAEFSHWPAFFSGSLEQFRHRAVGDMVR